MFKSKLVNIIEVAEKTVEFSLEKPSEYKFKPGQHTSVSIDKIKGENSDRTHTFSYTSDPSDTQISFMTRIRDSKYKDTLSKSKIGDIFELSAPSGFRIGEGLNQEDKILYFGAGVGITPLLSYLRSINSESPSVDLVWSNKSISTTPFFKGFSSKTFIKIDKLNTKFHMTREESSGDFSSGRLNIADVSKSIEISDPERIYIIGAPNFVDDIWSLVLSSGFSDEKITTENFGGY